MKLNDFFDRQVIEKYDIKPEIKKLTKKELLELLNRLFREEYQGRTVTYEIMEKEFFVKTTAKTRMHFGFRDKKTPFKGHMTKLFLGAGGEYMSLIENCEYSHSEKEKKKDQNSMHKNTDAWHYFTKTILCENTYYRVMVDVNESQTRGMVVYNVSLSPCKNTQKEKRDSMHSAPEPATDLRDEISSEDIIAQKDENVNRYSKNNFRKDSLDSRVKRAENKKRGQIDGDMSRDENNER